MSIKFSDQRDEVIVSEAIAFAIEGYSRLPAIYRPENDIFDLNEILSQLPDEEIKLLQTDAKRRVDILMASLNK